MECTIWLCSSKDLLECKPEWTLWIYYSYPLFWWTTQMHTECDIPYIHYTMNVLLECIIRTCLEYISWIANPLFSGLTMSMHKYTPSRCVSHSCSCSLKYNCASAYPHICTSQRQQIFTSCTRLTLTWCSWPWQGQRGVHAWGPAGGVLRAEPLVERRRRIVGLGSLYSSVNLPQPDGKDIINRCRWWETQLWERQTAGGRVWVLGPLQVNEGRLPQQLVGGHVGGHMEGWLQCTGL